MTKDDGGTKNYLIFCVLSCTMFTIRQHSLRKILFVDFIWTIVPHLVVLKKYCKNVKYDKNGQFAIKKGRKIEKIFYVVLRNFMFLYMPHLLISYLIL